MFPIRFREGERMDQERFRDWFTRVDDLTPAQRQEVSAALSGRARMRLRRSSSAWTKSGAARIAPAPAPSRGARRAVCGATAALRQDIRCPHRVRPHYKERWLSFGEALAKGETIVESAERSGLRRVRLTAGHRFLKAVRQAPDRLRGIVEADETFVLESRKGERKLDRKPRRRGGKARKRGLSREQVPVLVAAAVPARPSAAPCRSSTPRA